MLGEERLCQPWNVTEVCDSFESLVPLLKGHRVITGLSEGYQKVIGGLSEGYQRFIRVIRVTCRV